MGLLDRLARGVVGGAIDNLIENATNKNSQNPGPNAGPADYQANTYPPMNAGGPGAPVYQPMDIGGQAAAPAQTNVRAYFAEILASAFGSYQVRENVPLSEFGAQGRPYDFALYQNGGLAAVVVLAEHNRTRNHPYWNSEKKAKEMGVPFINFYTHMPNERGFVINRINRLMGH